MRVSGKTSTILVTTILTVGLMYSQVCNTACFFAACSQQGKVERSVPNKDAGSCHHHKSPAQNSESGSRHPSGSHDCNTHDTINSLLPITAAGVDWSHQSSQPGTISPFAFASFSLDQLVGGAAEITPFRAPPRQPQRSILRI
jgi:hypothetical protein